MVKAERAIRELENPPDDDNPMQRPTPEDQRQKLLLRLRTLLEAGTVNPETEVSVRHATNWVNSRTGDVEVEKCDVCEQPVEGYILLGKTTKDDRFTWPFDQFETQVAVCCGFTRSRQDRLDEIARALVARRASGEFDDEDPVFNQLLDDEDD